MMYWKSSKEISESQIWLNKEDKKEFLFTSHEGCAFKENCFCEKTVFKLATGVIIQF